MVGKPTSPGGGLPRTTGSTMSNRSVGSSRRMVGYRLATDDNNNGSTMESNRLVTTFFVYGAWSWPSWLTLLVPTLQKNDTPEPHLGHGFHFSTYKVNPYEAPTTSPTSIGGTSSNINNKTSPPRKDPDLNLALITGAVYASCQQALDTFARYQWRHYLYLAGLVLILVGCMVPNHGLLETYVDEYIFEGIGDWAIGVALAALLWTMGILVHAWAVARLERDLTAAMQDLNYPVFQLAGYNLVYRVEPTGPAYTLEHRIYCFLRPQTTPQFDHKLRQTKEPVSLLDVLPDSTRPLFQGKKTMYLHTASFWGNDAGYDASSPSQAKKEYLHRHEQTPMLRSIHPLFWGALHQAFWVDDMEQLRKQRRVRVLDALLALVLAVAWAYPSIAADQDKVAHSANIQYYTQVMWQSWALAIAIIGLLLAFYWAFLQVLLNRTAANVGHARWMRATAMLGPVMEKYGWRLEYHHPQENRNNDDNNNDDSDNGLDPRVLAESTGLAAMLNRNSNPPEYSLAFLPYVPV